MTPDQPNDLEQTTSADVPIDTGSFAWPEASIDPISRMRALASGLPYAASSETVLPASFDRVWSFISDFENNTAKYEGTVGGVRILDQDGDRLTLNARGPLPGSWTRFDVVLRPGWCLMSSKIGQIGMAAREESEHGTRFFHFEGSARLGRIMLPFFRWNIQQDFRRLRNLL